MHERRDKLPGIEWSEKDIQNQIVSWLNINHIYNERMNTGLASYENSTGENRKVKFGRKGMADLMIGIPVNGIVALGFVEVKSAKGKQSQFQEDFQMEMEFFGIPYILARSVEDVEQGISNYVEKVTLSPDTAE